MNTTITFLFLTLLLSSSFCLAQGHVSQNMNQMLTFDYDNENPPQSIYIKLNTSNIEVKYMKSVRVMVAGNIKLGIPNLFFLDVLIEKGRYDLYLSSDGSTGLRLEDKTRQPIILQGEPCKEDVSYTIFIPESITTVVFENSETGDSNVIAMHKEKKESSAPTASNSQVSIKDK